MTTKEQILDLATKLAAVDINNHAVKQARSWWTTQDRYSNHDFDVKSALQSELQRKRIPFTFYR